MEDQTRCKALLMPAARSTLMFKSLILGLSDALGRTLTDELIRFGREMDETVVVNKGVTWYGSGGERCLCCMTSTFGPLKVNYI